MQPTLHHLDGAERPLGRAERQPPSGQQPELQRQLLPAGHARRRSRAQVRRLLARREQPVASVTRAATRPSRFPTCRSTNDCSTEATGCQVDLARDGLSIYDLTEHLGVRAGRVHARPADGAARRPLRPQPRPGARRHCRGEPARADVAARRSTSPAPIRAWCSTTSRRGSD